MRYCGFLCPNVIRLVFSCRRSRADLVVGIGVLVLDVLVVVVVRVVAVLVVPASGRCPFVVAV